MEKLELRCIYFDQWRHTHLTFSTIVCWNSPLFIYFKFDAHSNPFSNTMNIGNSADELPISLPPSLSIFLSINCFFFTIHLTHAALILKIENKWKNTTLPRTVWRLSRTAAVLAASLHEAFCIFDVWAIRFQWIQYYLGQLVFESNIYNIRFIFSFSSDVSESVQVKAECYKTKTLWCVQANVNENPSEYSFVPDEITMNNHCE